jgi:hypothetical protein
MNFLHYEVTTAPGEAIRVILRGNAANVLVMDDTNYQKYRAGEEYKYFGRYYDRSPAIIRPPNGGRWHVVINLGGYAGNVNAVVQVVHT